jgi:hypothetical protein
MWLYSKSPSDKAGLYGSNGSIERRDGVGDGRQLLLEVQLIVAERRLRPGDVGD